LARLGFDGPEFCDVLGQSPQEPQPGLGPRLLASAEHDHYLDLVPGAQETLDVAAFGAVVVRVDLQAEANLLEDGSALVAAGVAGLLRGFVLELAVVHEFGHGRTGVWCDFDEVEIGIGGQAQRDIQLDDADLLPRRPHEAHLGYTTPVIDARLANVSAP
jgi:hypothetical protein